MAARSSFISMVTRFSDNQYLSESEHKQDCLTAPYDSEKECIR